jgi:D-glycero-alpha-D-manno-heptose-7-phosphate kinase
MLITRAPVRISFGGGGTDLEAYYARYGGMVVSAAIDKYFYTIISNGKRGDGIQIISSDYRAFYRQEQEQPVFWEGEGNLQLPRAILHHFGLQRSCNVFLSSEVPPGTGLGSSGSVAVTLVQAMATLCDRPLSKQDVAETAAHIEINKLGMPVGKQDQYAAAFGGLNVIRFERERVTVEPLKIAESTLHEFERSLLLFFTGSTRESSEILRQQKHASERDEGEVIEALHAIKELAHTTQQALERGELDQVGDLFHRAWENKKRLASNISNTRIDHCYEVARRQGALGGKITGAGGGGFLMLYCPPIYQKAVTSALAAEGLVRMDFQFDFRGVTVLMNTLEYARPRA